MNRLIKLSFTWGPMKRASAILIAAMLLLTLTPLYKARSQGGDLTVTIEPRDACVAGYSCDVNVSIRNLDGTVLLDYVKLITPWGAFTRNLGLRELRPDSTILVPILVNVDRNSLEGPNFVRPIVRFYKKGEFGLKLIEGNASSILVTRPRINASLLAVPQSHELYVGSPLTVDIDYEVSGIPRGYNPSLSVYIDGHLEIKRKLNGTSGGTRLSVPVGDEGNHTVTVSLCYGIGCMDKSFEVVVKKKVVVVSGYDQERKLLNTSLGKLKEKREILRAIYKRAAEDGLPIPEDLLANFSMLDYNIKNVESIVAERNISYVDIVRAKMLLNQSSIIVSNLERGLLGIYRNRLIDLIEAVKRRTESIRNLNRTEYLKLKDYLNRMEESIDELNLSSISDSYLNIRRELESIDRKIATVKERATEEAHLLSWITASLIFVAMISGAIVILRKWKLQLLRSEVR